MSSSPLRRRTTPRGSADVVRSARRCAHGPPPSSPSPPRRHRRPVGALAASGTAIVVSTSPTPPTCASSSTCTSLPLPRRLRRLLEPLTSSLMGGIALNACVVGTAAATTTPRGTLAASGPRSIAVNGCVVIVVTVRTPPRGSAAVVVHRIIVRVACVAPAAPAPLAASWERWRRRAARHRVPRSARRRGARPARRHPRPQGIVENAAPAPSPTRGGAGGVGELRRRVQGPTRRRRAPRGRRRTRCWRRLDVLGDCRGRQGTRLL